MKRNHKRDQLTDQALARLLTEAYDSRLAGSDAAPWANEAAPGRPASAFGPEERAGESAAATRQEMDPGPADNPAALRPIPLTDWAPPAAVPEKTQKPVPAPESEPAPPAPPPIPAEPPRRRFWLRAAAAALVVGLTAAGVLLVKNGALRGLAGEPAPNAAAQPGGEEDHMGPEVDTPSFEIWIPDNVHDVWDGDERFQVMDGEYEGEYHLQHPSARLIAERYGGMTEFDKMISSGYPKTPPGFAVRQVMTYEEYAAYCETWGLEQRYKDEDRSYLVYAWSQSQPEEDVPKLADVVWRNNSVWVWLWERRMLQDYATAVLYGNLDVVYWVLTIPADETAVDPAAMEVNICQVVTQEEYARYLDGHGAKIEETDGVFRILGSPCGHLFVDDPDYEPYESRLPFFPVIVMRAGGEEIGLIIDRDTELTNEDALPESGSTNRLVAALINETSSALRFYAEDCVPAKLPSADPFYNTVGTFYRVGRLTVLTGDEDPMSEPVFYAPLTEKEMLDRVRNPEAYESEIRSQSMVGGTQNCIVFDYDGGSLCVIFDVYDPEKIYGAYLFDSSGLLQQTLRGRAVSMPDAFSIQPYPKPRHQDLMGRTVEELVAQYGSPIFNADFTSGSRFYRPTWFTVEGELVTVQFDAAEDDPTAASVFTYNPFTGEITPGKSDAVITDPIVIVVPTDPAAPTETPEPTATAPALP